MNIPSVVLAGRPNVGKSALFNRIAGKRVAIVYHEAGVTRDRLERVVEADGRKFLLTDTGGVFALDGEKVSGAIDSGVRAQAVAALSNATVAVLVTDAQEGIAPMDLEVARLMRKAGVNVVVAANKADNASLDLNAADFARLGFPVFPVSAVHGRGISALMDACFARFPPAEPSEPSEPSDPAESPDSAAPNDPADPADSPPAPPPRPDRPTVVAVVGRPNCGKSSFLNKLLRTERVVVSDQPGTTRDPIDIPFEYSGREFVLVDTAGVRREARVDTAVERYSRFRMQDAVERADVLILMIDCERGPGLLDRQLCGLAAKLGKSCVLAVNKWDLAQEGERTYAERLATELPFMAHCPVVFLSAKTGRNVERVLATAAHVAAAAVAALPTGPLNRCLQEACKSNATPVSGTKPFKLHYAVQTGYAPVRIRLFVNDPRRMPGSFKQFLANRLRESFDLAGVAVELQFRARERRNPDGSAKPEKAPSNLRELRAAKKSSGKARRRRRAMPRG